MQARRSTLLAAALLLAVAHAQAQSLTAMEWSKLDPRFRSAVSDAFPDVNAQERGGAPPARLRTAQDRGISDDVRYGAIIQTDDVEALLRAGIAVHTEFSGHATARVTAAELVRLARHPAVRYVDAGRLLSPTNDLTRALVGADLVQAGFVNETPFTGKNVVVGVIDTGIDWRHEMFRSPSDLTRSRILYLWDVTLAPEGGESSPVEDCCSYGVEYDRESLEDALAGTSPGSVRSRDTNGHGTHVTGTAAGSGVDGPSKRYEGMAPEADLIVVKAGTNCFSEVDIINAMAYVAQKAEALGLPFVINLSLGHTGGPHDGSEPYEQFINALVEPAGRVVVSSAGNSGSNAIHREETLLPGEMASIHFSVPAYTVAELPANRCELDPFDYNAFSTDLWFDGTDNVVARAAAPDGSVVEQDADGERTDRTPGGEVYLVNQISPWNGDRAVQFTVTAIDTESTVAEGEWNLQIWNGGAKAVSFHLWQSERSVGNNKVVTMDGGDSLYTAGSPGNADGVISVASWTHRWRWMTDTQGARMVANSGHDFSDEVSSFSSRGPRRDGVLKPDVAAPGQMTASALSRDSTPRATRVLPGGKHSLNSGTSMASPVVAGAAALLLDVNPDLTAARIKELITETAREDALTGETPNTLWGHGRLDVFGAAVRALDPNAAVARETYAYEVWNVPDSWRPFGQAGYDLIAVRFSPIASGRVSGLFLHTFLQPHATSLTAQVYTNGADNFPDSPIGEPVLFAPGDILTYGWNFLDLKQTQAEVMAGTDYHVVMHTGAVGEVMELMFENGELDNRTTVWNGWTWVVHPEDLRARVIVATETGDMNPTPLEEGAMSLPTRFALVGNYPNPFNPSTRIVFDLPWAAEVELDVFDSVGRRVLSLPAQAVAAGSARVLGVESSALSSGVYFYRLTASAAGERHRRTGRMILAR